MKNSGIHIQAVVMIYVSAMIISLTACGKKGQESQAVDPVPVNVTEVYKEKVSFYVNYPGTAMALNEVELRSEVGGFITGIFFKEGEFIKRGRKLYEIDRSKYAASHEQARANVDIANANVERAQRYVDRYTRLSENDAIAKQRLDDAQTDLRNAGLQLVQAQAELVKSRTDLNFSVITAPFDGTIGLSQVKLGTLVIPGQTLMNTISSDDPMGVDFVINETELGAFQALTKKDIPPNDSTFRISLPDRSLYAERGKIEVIDRAIDPQTGTIRVRLEFPNHDKRLKAGMSCDVHVLNSSGHEQLVIPSKALFEQMSEYFVFVVDSQKANQTKISLGAQLKGKVIVTDGLLEGQKIVTDGIQKLRDGMAVKVGNESSGGGM